MVSFFFAGYTGMRFGKNSWNCFVYISLLKTRLRYGPSTIVFCMRLNFSPPTTFVVSPSVEGDLFWSINCFSSRAIWAGASLVCLASWKHAKAISPISFFGGTQSFISGNSTLNFFWIISWRSFAISSFILGR